jgi:predicted LPLAT superfamily acyltransferase
MKNKDSWDGKSRGGYWGYYFFIFIICNLGIGFSYGFLSIVVLYFIPFAPRATKAIWKYNRQILGYGVWKSAVKLYSHFFVFGQTIIDKIAVGNGLQSSYRFQFENYSDFLAILDKGPAIIIGAHVGCWEIGSRFFGNYAKKLSIVMYDNEYQKIKDAVRSIDSDYNIIAVNEGSVESLLRIKQVVDNNGYVCFQGDRYLYSDNTFPAILLNHKVLFPKGPFVLASKLKVPVIFYFAMREKGRRYRFIFHSVDAGASHNDLLLHYVAVLQDVVKAYPQQWFNFYDLWQNE